MPHKLGHFTPFTNFLTQGMQNTNQNINQMNSPTFSNTNFMNPQGGPSWGQQGSLIDSETLWQPGINTIPDPNPPNIEPTPFEQGSMAAGFDVNNDGVVDEQDVAAYQGLDWDPTHVNVGGYDAFSEWGQSFAEQLGYSSEIQIDNPNTWSFEEMVMQYINTYEHGAGWTQDGYDAGNAGPLFDIINQITEGGYVLQPPPEGGVSNPQEAMAWLQGQGTNFQQLMQQTWGELGYQADWLQNSTIAGENPQDWQGYLDQWWSQIPGTQGGELSQQEMYQQQVPYTILSPAEQAGWGSSYQEGFVENLLQFMDPQTSSPTEFRGGGGRGGEMSRKLYYPSVSGGVASKGSGLDMDSETLMDFLEQIQQGGLGG